MFSRVARQLGAWLLAALILLSGSSFGAAPPSTDELMKLLKGQPVNKDNWKTWRPKLREWSGEYYEAAQPAFKEAFAFAKSQLDGNGALPKSLSNNADAGVLWMLIGGEVLLDVDQSKPVLKAEEAEKYFRNSIKADNKLARSHFWMAVCLRKRELTPVKDGGPTSPNLGRIGETVKEFEEARKLDPKIKGITTGELGDLALMAGQYDKANVFLKEALKESADVNLALQLARSATTTVASYKPQRIALVQPLTEQFPTNGELRAFYALALSMEKKPGDALVQLEEARKLKADFNKVGHEADITSIDEYSKKNPEPLLLQKMKENPKDANIAAEYAKAVFERRKEGDKSKPIKDLIDNFPKDGPIRSWYAVALYYDQKYDDAYRQLEEARKLKADPSTIVSPEDVRKIDDHADRNPEKFLAQKYKEKPGDIDLARKYARFLEQRNSSEPKAPVVKKEVLDKFPKDPTIRIYYAVALMKDQRLDEAVTQLENVRKNGAEPKDLVTADEFKRIDEHRDFQRKTAADKKADADRKKADEERKRAEEQQAREQQETLHSLVNTPIQFAKTVGWWAMWFSIVYGTIMILMCVGGLILARKTTGSHAMDMLDKPATQLVAPGGQVVRSDHETKLKRFYLFSLLTALVLFYFSLPFVFMGLLLIFLITFVLMIFTTRGRHGQGDEISDMKRASAGGMKAVFKAMFASASNFHFGMQKEREDCPRLWKAIEDVAQRVDTEPVDEIWISPGADFYVTQQGRGPFGVFGGRKRVLMIGLCVMSYLSISELKAILAHEYAHFSHADTFWSRFVFQVSLSLRVAMHEMTKTGGWVTMINPFYWFFYLYSKSYNVLSAGFSRSREYLADRMACSLYGSDVFARGLIKICTDGTLFEKTIYGNIVAQLKKKKAFVNMYLAFREFREKAYTDEERRKLYKKLLDDKPSVFSTHPTFGERLAAAKTLPNSKNADQTAALQLFEKPEEMEREMTDWLTEIVDRVINN